MATDKEVAEWMASHFEKQARLYQETVVYKIRSHFGKDFVYQNANGNLAISKKVLTEFRKITDGKIVWERGERAWRKVRPGEKMKGRQVE